MQKLTDRIALLRHGRWALICALLALAFAVSASGALTRIDTLLFDAGQRLLKPAPAADIVIVGVDEASLARIGRWPWPRQAHADLLERLCRDGVRPKVIGIDIAFPEASRDAADDTALAAAIRRCGNVVLPIVIERSGVGSGIIVSPPLPPFAGAAAAMGRVGVNLGDDGIARSVYPLETIGTHSMRLFADAVLEVAGFPNATLRAPQSERLFGFAGPTGSVPHVSYTRVLQGEIDSSTFAGKIVLVGATAVGLGDFLPTPVSGRDHPMPGVEIQSHVIQAMRGQRLILELPAGWRIALNLLLAVVPLLWLPRLMPLAGLLASAAWVGALCLLGILHPHLLQVWVPPSGALVAALSAFPLWSWRRLEVTRKHLLREFERLQAALALENGGKPGARLGFEQQISWIQAAQSRMRTLELQRNEALAFISHDLRAPLASALLMLEQNDGPDHARMVQQLRRAHDMAQTFLYLSRAELLESSQMQELDLVAVLYQAIDQLYALAQSRQVGFRSTLPDDPVWVNGDFSLLERSVVNLLHNAVMHSPAGGTVDVDMTVRGTQVEVRIRDQGPGMHPEQIARLFHRFSTGSTAPREHSTGLGLYLVRKVAEKHDGAVGVESTPNNGACFWMRLASLP